MGPRYADVVNIVGEIVKALRVIREVLAEYVAAEKEKQAAACRKAAEEVEAARRRAAEEASQAAAREAEAHMAAERLLTRRESEKSGRRRTRRGEGPRPSAPVSSQGPAILATAATPAAPLIAESLTLPPALAALLARFQQLQQAIQGLLTATPSLRAWFERQMKDIQRRNSLEGGVAGLMFALERISRRHYRRLQAQRHLEKIEAERARADRMFAGGWREAIRYLVWVGHKDQTERLLTPPAALAPA